MGKTHPQTPTRLWTSYYPITGTTHKKVCKANEGKKDKSMYAARAGYEYVGKTHNKTECWQVCTSTKELGPYKNLEN